MQPELNEILSLQQLITGVGLALLVGLLGWAARALAVSGMIGAMVIGTLIFGLGGLPWAALMLAFFISSSLLSRMFSSRKKNLAQKFEKGSRRDWAQVFANGGAGAFLAVVSLLFPFEGWPWLAFAGAMATVTADTWATELGVLSPTKPRLITSGKPVPTGTSGGVTLMGTVATFAGGTFIGLTGWAFAPDYRTAAFLTVVAFAGLAGSLVDSLLGATIQAIYYDPERDKETERKIFHPDGTLAAAVRGVVWMNNDMVNFVSSITGAVTAVLLWNLLG